MENKDKIGSLFKNAFHSSRDSVNLEEFELMNQLISKNSFYRFTANCFNIYYAAAIVSSFLITLALGGHYISTHEIYHTKKVEIIQMIEPARAENKVLSEKTVSSSIKTKGSKWKKENREDFSVRNKIQQNNLYLESKKDNRSPNNTQENNVFPEIKLEKQESTKQENINEDSYHHSIISDSSKQQNSAKPKRKTVIIVQKDTIYQIDTLRRLPNRKRKKIN